MGVESKAPASEGAQVLQGMRCAAANATCSNLPVKEVTRITFHAVTFWPKERALLNTLAMSETDATFQPARF